MFGSIHLVEVGFVLNRDSSLRDGSRFVFLSYIFMVIHRFMVSVVCD
jgi:hypothetical protein